MLSHEIQLEINSNVFPWIRYDCIGLCGCSGVCVWYNDSHWTNPIYICVCVQQHSQRNTTKCPGICRMVMDWYPFLRAYTWSTCLVLFVVLILCEFRFLFCCHFSPYFVVVAVLFQCFVLLLLFFTNPFNNVHKFFNTQEKYINFTTYMV